MALAVFSRPTNWIKQQYERSRLIHAGLVMAVMGWAPFVWTPLTISLALAYTAIKRKELMVYLHDIKSNITDFFLGSIEEKRQARIKGEHNKSFFWSHIGNLFNLSPLNVGKALFSIYIMAIVSMPWSMFMIYAFYRPRTEIVQAVYAQSKTVVRALLSFYQSLSNVKKMIFVLLGVSLSSGILNTILVRGGLLGLFDATATIAMLGLMLAGVRLGVGDFFRALSDPIKLLTNKMGILLGMIGGNRFAHYIFSGKISGILGPAYGVVESSGIFPSLYRMFFSTNPYGHSNFYFANSVVGVLFNRMSTGVGGLFGSLFLSHDVMTHGTFHGVLGPTSYQLLAFMAMGAAVGYFIDKAVDRVSNLVKADAIKTWENNPNSPSYSKKVTHIKSAVNFANHYRFTVTMTLIATGLFSGLRMPFYMSMLHTTASPLLSILCIEAALLFPALLVTKLYRVANAQVQKYFRKKPVAVAEGGKLNLPKMFNQDQDLDLDLEANLKTEREIERERNIEIEKVLDQLQSPEEMEAQWLKAQIEDYEASNEPQKPESTIRAPQLVSFVFQPYRPVAAVTPEEIIEEQQLDVSAEKTESGVLQSKPM
jgi:hypothetical protein